uniref:Uncharacterized protein n=1 Tax=Ciona savignyi TaxID=51511 RepID=H2ZNQ7_CIOSA
MLLSLSAEVLWNTTSEHQFNSIAFGKLFASEKNTLILAGEDGVVRVYEDPSADDKWDVKLKLVRSLETKCGPALHVVLRDMTRLSPCDMIVGDTRGSVVLFCDGQILDRRGCLSGKSSRITSLQVQETALGNVNVILGRDDGEVICFNTFSQLWKLRLSDISTQTRNTSVSVTCLLPVSMITSWANGNAEDYVLVADSQGNVHIIQDGNVLRTIEVPSSVQCMCAGNFLLHEDTSSSKKVLTQIALGCADGSIWICADFCLNSSFPYVEIGHPITHLRRIPTKHNYANNSPIGNASNGEGVDMLLCGGHFSSLKLLQHGKLLYAIDLPSWPIALCGLHDYVNPDLNPDKTLTNDDSMIIVGCKDSTLRLVSIT